MGYKKAMIYKKDIITLRKSANAILLSLLLKFSESYKVFISFRSPEAELS